MTAVGFTVTKCVGCGAQYFPRRLICHRCGQDRWTEVIVSEAVIEEATTVEQAVGRKGPSHLATALTDHGLRMIVGSDAPLQSGARVRLGSKEGAPFVQT
jgi:uncharacterized OB-fold protein